MSRRYDGWSCFGRGRWKWNISCYWESWLMPDFNCSNLVQSKERRSRRWSCRRWIKDRLLRSTPDWHKHQEHCKHLRCLPHQVNFQQHFHPRDWSLRSWNLLPHHRRYESQGWQRRVIPLRCYACRRWRLQRTPICWHQRYSHQASWTRWCYGQDPRTWCPICH